MKQFLFPIPKSKKPKMERLREAYTNSIGAGPTNFRRRRKDIVEKAKAALERAERAEIAKARNGYPAPEATPTLL